MQSGERSIPKKWGSKTKSEAAWSEITWKRSSFGAFSWSTIAVYTCLRPFCDLYTGERRSMLDTARRMVLRSARDEGKYRLGTRQAARCHHGDRRAVQCNRRNPLDHAKKIRADLPTRRRWHRVRWPLVH